MKLPISFINFVDKATQWVYHVTGGWLGGKQLKHSILLLQTTGRKTGKQRTHTLLYVRDGENIVIIASNNGQPHHPAWYWNLKANPRAHMQTGRWHYEVVAEEVSGEEHARLWQKFLANRPQYVEYRK